MARGRDYTPDEQREPVSRIPSPDRASDLEVAEQGSRDGGQGSGPATHGSSEARSPEAERNRFERRPYPDIDRDRAVMLRDSEIKTLTEIGTFRAIAAEDLTRFRYAGDDRQAWRDLNNLAREGLIRRRTDLPRKRTYLALTPEGHRLIEAHRPHGTDPRQVLYHGFVKPREVRHDAALYRLYQEGAGRIAREGGKVQRVVLDFELKKSVYRQLARLRELPESEQAQRRQEAAQEHGLTVVNGKIPLPDLRIEYETAERDQTKVDLELATSDYHRDSLAEKSQAGFRHFCDARGRRATPPGHRRSRAYEGYFFDMNIRSDDLTAIERLGYTEGEARFLYLVATHSGYFTQHQFLRFSGKPKGWSVHHLTTKTLDRRHARSTEYAKQILVFNLYARRLYGAIGKDNLRNRRRQSNELIHTRLLILDFVLAHPDEAYFETEADKVAYFHDTLSVPLPMLPGRIYPGLKSTKSTKRCFVDRFPVFIPRQENTFSLPAVVTFTYCDTADPSLLGYVTHLRSYEKLLRRLPDFNFIYASPDPKKFARARSFFERLFRDPSRVDGHRLRRYFELRMLWDGPKSWELIRADRDFLRDGLERYHGEPFESAYQKWSTVGLSMDEVKVLLGPREAGPQRRFETYRLPEAYDIFHREAGPLYRPLRYNEGSVSRSVSRSVPCDC